MSGQQQITWDDAPKAPPAVTWDEPKKTEEEPGFFQTAYKRLATNIVTPLQAAEHVGNAIFDPKSTERAEINAGLKKPLDLKAGLKRTAESLPPVAVAESIPDYWKHPGNLLGDAATAAILHAAGGGEERVPGKATAETTAETAAERPIARPKATAAEKEPATMLGRAGKVAMRRVSDNP